MKDDLISRQAAVEALEAKKDKSAKGDMGCFYNTIIQNDIDALKGLPSARPEIIRCKDCRWWERTSICEGHCIEIDIHHVDEDHYCSYAERRTDERPDRQTEGG